MEQRGILAIFLAVGFCLVIGVTLLQVVRDIKRKRSLTEGEKVAATMLNLYWMRNVDRENKRRF